MSFVCFSKAIKREPGAFKARENSRPCSLGFRFVAVFGIAEKIYVIWNRPARQLSAALPGR
jgi:hypothetical protein